MMMNAPGLLVAIADHVTDGIIVADESGLAYVNSRALMLLGANRSEDVIGESLSTLFQHDACSEIMRSTLPREGDNGGTPIVGRLLRIDGRTVDVSGTSCSILWEGTRSCRLLVVRKISQVDAGDNTTVHTEAYPESAQIVSRVGSWEWDLGAGTETWSDEQYRILGYEPGTVLPTHDTFQKVLHPDDRDRVSGALKQSLVSDTPYDVECRIIRPSGMLRSIRCRGVVIRSVAGNPIRMLGTIEDRTETIRLEASAERAIEESSERLDLIAQAGHVGIFEQDHRTDRVYWSPILRDIFGMSADEPASFQRYVKLIDRADRRRILSAIRTATNSTGDGCVQIEHRIVRPDRTVRHIRLYSRTKCEREGSARGSRYTIGTVVDITDCALAETFRREVSKMETLSTLAGGVAHEFNNSLTAVLGFSQLALPLIPADNKARRHIQQVIAAGRAASELTHQLSMVGRRREAIRRFLLLSVLVKESVKLVRSTIPSWVELSEQIVDSTSPIEANETEMRQLLVILVNSAVQGMRYAAGMLAIELNEKKLSADLTAADCRIPAGRYVCLSIKSSAGGLDAQAVAAIDAPFLAAQLRDEERGAGLSLVRDIAADHGGTVLVERGAGLGTTVSVYLPVQTVCAASVPEEDGSIPRGHEGILFVTAKESCAKRGREMLKSLGYYTVVRRHATDALEAFSLAPRYFDLLITDQTLPDMTGDQLARECRQLRPDLSVIFCVGSEEVLSAEKAHLLGIDERIVRPFVVHDVAPAIRRVLDRSPRSSSAPSLSSGVGGRAHESPASLIEESDAIGPRG